MCVEYTAMNAFALGLYSLRTFSIKRFLWNTVFMEHSQNDKNIFKISESILNDNSVLNFIDLTATHLNFKLCFNRHLVFEFQGD